LVEHLNFALHVESFHLFLFELILKLEAGLVLSAQLILALLPGFIIKGLVDLLLVLQF
jgi:hypothetical protein